MQFLDNIIVATFTNLIRGVFAIRTGFAYIQFLILSLVVLTIGIGILVGIGFIIKNTLF